MSGRNSSQWHSLWKPLVNYRPLRRIRDLPRNRHYRPAHFANLIHVEIPRLVSRAVITPLETGEEVESGNSVLDERHGVGRLVRRRRPEPR